MEDKDQCDDYMRELRERAERRLTPNGKRDIAGMSTEEVAEVLHELEMHQIELQMQNEELHQLLDKLTETRDQYAELYDGAPLGYVTMNEKGHILQSNRTFAKMLGVAGSRLLNTPLSDHIVPADQDIYYAHRRAAMDTWERQCGELRLQTNSGVVLWVRMDSVCVECPARSGTELRSVFVDITARKQAQDAAAREQERLQFIFDALPIGISLNRVHADGGETRLINDAHLRIAGIRREQDEVKTWVSLRHPDDQARQKFFDDQLAEGKISQYSMDKRYVQPDGGEVWILFSKQRRKLDDGGFEDLCTVVDITERKRAERALWESEAYLRTLFKTIPDLVWLKNPEGIYLGCNPALEHLYGVKEAEIVGKSEYDFVDQEEADFFRDHDRKAIEVGGPSVNEERLTFADGYEGEFETIKTPMRDADGNLIGVLGVARDITGRKRAERALQESEAYLRTLIETIPDLVLVKDPAGVYLACNPAFARLYGATEAEMIGKTDYDFVDPEVADFFRATDRKVIAVGGPSVNEEHLIFADGSYEGDFEALKTPMLDVDGNLIGTLGIARDITERKRAEQELRESEENYRGLFESSHDAIVTLEPPSWEFTSANAATVKMFRAQNEAELISCGPWDLSPEKQPDGRVSGEIIPVMIETAMREGSAFFESTLRRIDGEEFSATVLLSRVGAGDGAFLQATVRDITALKQAQAAAVREQERLQFIFDALPIGISLNQTHRDGSESRMINEAHLRIAGISREEDELKTWLSLNHPDDEAQRKFFENQLDEGEINQFSMDKRYVHPDGREVWVLFSRQRRKLDDGGFEDLCTVVDITERKQAEAEKERLMKAIEQVMESIMITDAEGTIQYVNPAFEAITGYSREEAIGQNPRMLKSGQQTDAFYENLWATLRRGKTWAGRIVNRKKDGTLYTEEATISPVKDSVGTIVNYVAIKSDITNELVLEEQYRQTQKMESIGRLAAGIAHDFNNILQSITGFSEMLMMGMDGCIAGQPPNCVAYRADVEEIHKAALYAADLTRQLLTFSRKQPAEHRLIELNAILADEMRMLERVIDERIDLQLDLCPEPLPISADASQIVQIVMNLVTNARDAMPVRGTVRVATQGLWITEDEARGMPRSRSGEFACLSVSDDGHGMNAEQLRHLFEPFYTSKKNGKGTGLGLSVIYGIVETHHGWITVSSAIDAGTTFRVYLPIQQGDGAAAEDLPNVAAPASLRIMLVEDDPVVRSLAEEILQNMGYEVASVGSALEAEELFARNGGTFELLFCDVMLPDGNGVELAEAFTNQRAGLSVLLFSGGSDAEIDMQRIRQRGFAFMRKPFSLSAVLDAVRQAIRKA